MTNVKIFRFDPEREKEPSYVTIDVPQLWEKMTVLDILEYVNDRLGVDIAYRSYCGTKKCGTCGVSVDGKPCLACMTVVRKRKIRIDPLAGFKVIRDLVIERSDYTERFLTIHPYLVRQTEYSDFPERITPNEMKESVEMKRCIECLLCTSACPSYKINPRFAGPAVFAQLGRYGLDPRDGDDRTRLAASQAAHSCLKCRACVEVCPTDAKLGIIDFIDRVQRECAAKQVVDDKGYKSNDLRQMLNGFL